MIDIYMQQRSLILRSNDRDLTFSQVEIETIRKIWDLLHITTLSFAGSNLKASTSPYLKNDELLQSLTPKTAKLTVINKNSGSSVEINNEKAAEFEFKLASNILQYLRVRCHTEGSHYRGPEVTTYGDVQFDYHLRTLINLISDIVYNLENVNNSVTVLATSKICSRIWNLDATHYNLIGEGIVLTILEEVGRRHFSPDVEYTWLKFYNKLANLLQFEGEDSCFDLPTLETPRSKFPSDAITISTISARSSINFPDDEIYSIKELPSPKYLEKPSLGQDNEKSNLLNGIAEEKEDDSYDLINVFDDGRPEPKDLNKKGYRNSIKRFGSRRKSYF